MQSMITDRPPERCKTVYSPSTSFFYKSGTISPGGSYVNVVVKYSDFCLDDWQELTDREKDHWRERVDSLHVALCRLARSGPETRRMVDESIEAMSVRMDDLAEVIQELLDKSER